MSAAVPRKLAATPTWTRERDAYLAEAVLAGTDDLTIWLELACIHGKRIRSRNAVPRRVKALGLAPKKAKATPVWTPERDALLAAEFGSTALDLRGLFARIRALPAKRNPRSVAAMVTRAYLLGLCRPAQADLPFPSNAATPTTTEAIAP